MIERNIKGEPVTLEDIFHSLRTRLYHIKHYKEILDYDYKQVTKSIEDNFLGFNPPGCLIHINSARAEVVQLIDSCEAMVKEVRFEWMFDKESEPINYEQTERSNLYQLLSQELDYYKSSLEIYKNAIEQGIRQQEDITTSMSAVSKLPFQKIKLKEGLAINHIPTFYWNLIQEKKIETSKENLIKMILATFLDSKGQPLKKSTIETIFKNNKPFARSKDFT